MVFLKTIIEAITYYDVKSITSSFLEIRITLPNLSNTVNKYIVSI